MSRKFTISFLFCILIICSLTSCKKKKEDAYGFTPPLDNLSWGMTKEEVEKNFEVSNNETYNQDGETNGYTALDLKSTKNMFGYDGKVVFTFEDGSYNYDTDSNILESVSIVYKDADFLKLKANMDKEIGYKGEYLGDTASSFYATWYSKDKIRDIKDESLKKQLTESWKKLNTKETLKNNDETPINYISFTYNKEQTACVVTYHSDHALMISQISKKHD